MALSLRTNWRNNSNPVTEAKTLIAHTLCAEGADASEDGTGRWVPLVAQPLCANRWGGSDSHGDEGNVVAQAMIVRRLTPTECCRLQGFPDDWFDGTGLSDSAMYRTLGNAVCVPVAEWIGRRLVKVDTELGIEHFRAKYKE